MASARKIKRRMGGRNVRVPMRLARLIQSINMRAAAKAARDFDAVAKLFAEKFTQFIMSASRMPVFVLHLPPPRSAELLALHRAFDIATRAGVRRVALPGEG